MTLREVLHCTTIRNPVLSRTGCPLYTGTARLALHGGTACWIKNLCPLSGREVQFVSRFDQKWCVTPNKFVAAAAGAKKIRSEGHPVVGLEVSRCTFSSRSIWEGHAVKRRDREGHLTFWPIDRHARSVMEFPTYDWLSPIERLATR
jgi:hypothetical protein